MRTRIPTATGRGEADAQHTAPGFVPSATLPAARFSASQSTVGQTYRLQGLASNSARVKLLHDAPTVPGTVAEAQYGDGLPLHLQNGIEALSGLSMDDVSVHYNSPQPAQVGALAYAQGRTIHLGPGQEAQLPHEAWHVVQQAQGRVKPNHQLSLGATMNDEQALESEADVMGMRAGRISLPGISSGPTVSPPMPPMPPAGSPHGDVRQLRRLPSPEKLTTLLLNPAHYAATLVNTEAHRQGLISLLESLIHEGNAKMPDASVIDLTDSELLSTVDNFLRDDSSLELKLPTFLDEKLDGVDTTTRNQLGHLVAGTDELFNEVEDPRWAEALKKAFPQSDGIQEDGELKQEFSLDEEIKYADEVLRNYKRARVIMQAAHNDGRIIIDQSGYLTEVALSGMQYEVSEGELKARIVLNPVILANYKQARLTLLHESMHLSNKDIGDSMYPDHPDFEKLHSYEKLENASHYEVVPKIIIDSKEKSGNPSLAPAQSAPSALTVLPSLPSAAVEHPAPSPAVEHPAPAVSGATPLIVMRDFIEREASLPVSMDLAENEELSDNSSQEDQDSGAASATESDAKSQFELAYSALLTANEVSRSSYAHLLTLYHAPDRWNAEPLRTSLSNLSKLMGLTIHQKKLIKPELKSPHFDPVSQIDLALAEGLTRKLAIASTKVSKMKREQTQSKTKEELIEYALKEAGISGDMKNNMKIVNELKAATDALENSLDSKLNTPSAEPLNKRPRTGD